MTIREAGAIAARKKFPNELRTAVGTTDLAALEIHNLTWDRLHRCKQELSALCRKAIDLHERHNDEDYDLAANAMLDVVDEIESELKCRERIGNKEPRSHNGDPRRPFGEDATASAEGEEIKGPARRDAWRDKRGEEIRTYTPNERMSQGNAAGFSFGTAVRALVFGARNEAEERALSEGTASAGGYTVPAPLASEFIDALRAQSVAVQSGAITVPMTSDTLQIAKLASDPGFSWRAENAAVGGSDPTFGRVLFQARSCAAIVRASRELLEDSVNAEQMLMQAFAKAAALEMDRAALRGTGTNDEPTGILNIAGINTVDMGANGAAFADWDKWLDAIYELEQDNVPGPYSAVMHPRTARDLRKIKDSQANYLTMPPSIAEIARRNTTALPIDQTHGTATDASSAIVGNFSELMLGIRGDLRVEVLRERYADNNQIGFLAHFRMDVQVRHPEAFCAINGIVPA